MSLGLPEQVGSINRGLRGLMAPARTGGRVRPCKPYDTSTARRLGRRAERAFYKREDRALVGTDAEYTVRPKRYGGWWL